MYNNDVRCEEYYEKLGAILRAMDRFDIDDNDRAALSWIALDYLGLLGDATGIEPKK